MAFVRSMRLAIYNTRRGGGGGGGGGTHDEGLRTSALEAMLIQANVYLNTTLPSISFPSIRCLTKCFP